MSETEEQETFSVTYEGDDAARAYLYKDGPATATFPNSDTYTGAYLNTLKHGPSTYTFTSISPSTLYTGHYAAGQRHGQGALTYPDGSSYQGAWEQGKRHGWGRYTYANGDVWVGEWKEGKKEGGGTYVYKRDGSAFEGVWKDNQCRDGVWSYHSQRQFKAEVKDNRVTRYL